MVWLGLLLTLPAALAFGFVLEVLVFRHLYGRDHLDQVLATYGLILFFNQMATIIFGRCSSAIWRTSSKSMRWSLAPTL